MRPALSRLVALLVPLCGLFAAGYGQTQNEMYIRRFAFIVGANQGGSGRVTLNYAVEDARSIKKVLEDMGGIRLSRRKVFILDQDVLHKVAEGIPDTG